MKTIRLKEQDIQRMVKRVLNKQRDWAKGLPIENMEVTIDWIKRKLLGMMNKTLCRN